MTAPRPPLVSILIRSMDRPTLQRALQSAALQTWPNLEIIVVAACGRSHRPLPGTIEGRPVRLVLPQPDRQLSRPEAANACLEAAQGEWLNFLDDDDELLPEHVSTLLSASRSADERVLFSSARVHDAEGRLLGLISHDGHHVELYFHSRATPCAFMLHRSLVDEGARFDPAFPVYDDHDFQINCATRTEFRFVDAANCVWNATIGESGCGFGANDDVAQRVESLTRIRGKWMPVFRRWLRDVDGLRATGRQFLRTGDMPAARECFERAVTLDPADVDALDLCGTTHFQAGNLERAEYLFSRALRLAPDRRELAENIERVRARRPPAYHTGSTRMTFIQSLRRAWQRSGSLLCVGLDPEPGRLPAPLRDHADGVYEFCRAIVDATADLVCCFKPQIAHFAAQRAENALERLIAYIHEHHPGVLVVLDAKRGDIGSTARHYAAEAFDRYGADAVTLNPYLGRDALEPFLERADKGAFILCHTSNPGARDLQEQMVSAGSDSQALYRYVAALAAHDWNANGNCGLVVGATYPQELAEVRRIVGDAVPLLVPGIGAQGGDLAAVIEGGKNSHGTGLLISSSRAILYASAEEDFAAAAREAARALREQINVHRSGLAPIVPARD